MIRRLPIQLTDIEKLELGERIANLIDESIQLELKNKSIRAQLKDEEERLEKEYRYLAAELREGKRELEVEVEEEFDHETLMVHCVNVAGVRVCSRPMNQNEMDAVRKPSLPFDKKLVAEAQKEIDGAGHRYPKSGKKVRVEGVQPS